MSCRLIIVEGIMGSGKSRTTQWLADNLKSQGYAARAISEEFWPHPVRAITDLKKPLAPWLELTPFELARKSQDKWRRFVGNTCKNDEVYVMDGQLFHGDMTSMMLMEMPFADIRKYIKSIKKEIEQLEPLLIYFYQDDIAKALGRISDLRNPEWLEVQLSWKLQSPYCQRRQLSGFSGYIDFYKEYRCLTDYLFMVLDLCKCKIGNQDQDWNYYYQVICENLWEKSGIILACHGESLN